VIARVEDAGANRVQAIAMSLREGDEALEETASAERRDYIQQLTTCSLWFQAEAAKSQKAVQSKANEGMVTMARMKAMGLVPTIASDLRKEDPFLSVLQSTEAAKKALNLD
jgi:hypothetical protein